MTLKLSTVENSSLYASFRGYPMEESANLLSASIVSDAERPNAWVGTFATNGFGNGWKSECKNGEYSGFTSGGSATDLTIEISNATDTFLEGTYVQHQGDSVRQQGSFKAPIRKLRTMANAAETFQAFSPTKLVCCKLE